MNQTQIQICPVCGGSDFQFTPILWSGLIQEWNLSEVEAEYIDRQQGYTCIRCGNNLRSMALADAILKTYDIRTTLTEAANNPVTKDLQILEVNPAGGLTTTLQLFRHHSIVTHPEIDLCSLDLPSHKYDLVLHSDTLEHIDHPELALKECRRVLRCNGRSIFTVPLLVGRMSRSRRALPPSYHGHRGCQDEDQLVHTEFGADVWTYVLAAGFSSCTISSIDYPAGLAIAARV